MPQHKRGPWSQGEDNYLLSLVNIHGAHNWVRISQAIQTRSPKQCRERFHQNLKPNLNHDPITPEEGVLIEQMVAEMGKRWAEIARRLRGRSDNAVKNWWNGGMNRRRRNNQPRRTAVELRAPQQPPPMAPAHLAAQQHPLPSNFPPSAAMPQQYFNVPAPMYAGMPQPLRVPSNGPAFRAPGLVDTPLPSPSAYSQMSNDGAPPSLISDSSSISARSPHNGASPIELPPLSGSRSERRQSTAPMLQLGVPGSFVQDGDFQHQAIQFQRFGEQDKHVARGLQEPFIPQQMQQGFVNPMQYIPAHLQRSTGVQMPRGPAPPHYMMSQQPQYQHPQQAMHRPPPPQQLLPSQPAVAVQLPSISTLPAPPQGDGQFIDADRETPVPSAPSPDGSPKDKMSLSNLTH